MDVHLRACLTALVAAAMGTVHFNGREDLQHGLDHWPRDVGQRAEWLAINRTNGVGVAVGMLIDAGAAEHVAIGGDGVEQRQGADRALEVLSDLGVVDIHVRLLGEPVKNIDFRDRELIFEFDLERLVFRGGSKTDLVELLAIDAINPNLP